MKVADIKCIECGGRKFARTTFYYMWLSEQIDLDTGETDEHEIEREYMEQQSGWECMTDKCYGYIEWDEDEEDDGDEFLDELWYEKKWGEKR